MESSLFKNRWRVYVGKSVFWIFLSIYVLSVASCTKGADEPTAAPKTCECEDGSGKTWPRWASCGEVVEESMGNQGYYGEIQKTKMPAYFLANCR